ncbi:DUF3638 domain-containing protein [Criblamydia sequanensis]|uniref:ubiquitinyl hydrolase 1 n=1 Tax=Candidatus Criblamydia sequanensis CRIB-18 TaxID=1437425 RepID=A0A090CZH2_9BACT|nr:DUF3638 domain-containing protein [Criblamydia sequanensis]CDR34502.1 putative membrane protein [Criblamydia sequanensis CRIB-18]
MFFDARALPKGSPSFFPTDLYKRNEEALKEDAPARIEREEVSFNDKPKSFETFDLKLFANETSDSLIKDTSLEGTSFHKAIDRFSNVLESVFEQLARRGNTVPSFNLQCLNQIKEVSLELEDVALSYSLKNYKKLVDKLSDRFADLQKGESFYFPGGWYGRPGHAMIYIVERQNNGKFSFTIVNTGAGLENHPSYFKNGKRYYQTHLKKRDIEEADLLNNDFISSLIEPQIYPIWKIKNEASEKNIYQGIFSSLRGTVEKLDFNLFPEFFETSQNAGTCTFKSLFASLRQKCLTGFPTKEEGLNFYKTIKFHYKNNALLDACYDYFVVNLNEHLRTKSRLNVNFNERLRTKPTLIKNLAQNQARAALKLFNKGLISSHELKEIENLITEINRRLEERKKLEKKATSKPPIQFADVLPRPIIETFNCLNQPSFSSLATNNKSSEATLKLDRANLLIEIQEAPPINSVDVYLKNATDVLEGLLKRANEKDSKLLQEILIKLTKSLPIPNKNKPYWDSLPDEKIETCLESLYKISRLFLSVSTCLKEGLSPEAYLELHALTAIAEFLCFKKNDLNISKEVLPIEGLIVFYQKAGVHLKDPLAHDRLQEILECRKNPYDLTKTERNFAASYKNSLFYFTDKYYQGELANGFWRSDLQQNKYGKYLKKCLSDSGIQRQLKKHRLDSLPEKKKIKKLHEDRLEINDMDRLLPKSHHYLRQIFLATELRVPNSKASAGEFMEFIQRGKYYYCKMKGDNNTPKRIESKRAEKWSFHNIELIPSNKLEFAGLSQNKLMFQREMEAQQEEGLISVSGPDEIIRAIDFYETLPISEYENEAKRARLASHFFRPLRLKNAITSDPRVAVKIFNFLHQKIDYFKSKNNIEAVLFFVNLASAITPHIYHLFKTHRNRFEELGLKNLMFIRDYRDELQNHVLPLSKTLEAKIEVYRQIAYIRGSNSEVIEAFLAGTLDEETKELLALDLLTERILPEDQSAYPFTVDSEKAQIILEKRLFEFLNSDKKDSILNKLLNRFIEGEHDWNPLSDTCFSANNGLLKIDFSTGYLINNNRFLFPIPRAVSEHPLFLKVFKNVTDIVPYSDQKGVISNFIIYEGKEESKVFLEIQKGRVKDIIIYKTIDNRKCISVNAKELKQKLRDVLKVDILDEEDVVWKSSLKDGKGYFRIERKNGDFFLIHFTEDSEKTFNVTGITRNDSPYQIVDAYHFPVLNKMGIENLSQILCLVNPKNGHLKQIEYLRLNLSFDVRDVKGQRFAFSKEFPGFYIAPDQNKSFCGLSNLGLILENSEGQRKFILPNNKRDFRAVKGKPFDILELPSEKGTRALAYDIETTSSGDRLKPLSSYDALYAAYLMALQKHYGQSLYYINKALTVKAYTKEELELIKTFLSKLKSDGHPSARVLYLRIFLIQRENTQKYTPNDLGKISQEDLLEVGSCYSEWLKLRRNETACRLSLSEEKSLLRLFFDSHSKMADSGKILKGIIGIVSCLKSRLRELTTRAEEPFSDPNIELFSQYLNTPVKGSFSKIKGDFFKVFGNYLKPLEDFNETLTISGSEFRTWVPTFYNILVEAYQNNTKENVEKANKVSKILTLMEGSSFCSKKHEKHFHFFYFLKQVRDYPSKFPPLSQIKEFIEYNGLDPCQKWAGKSNGDSFLMKLDALSKHLPGPKKQSLVNAVSTLKKTDDLETLINEVPKLEEFLELSFKVSPAEIKESAFDIDTEVIDPIFDKYVKNFFDQDRVAPQESFSFDPFGEDELTKTKSEELKHRMDVYYAAKKDNQVLYTLKSGASLEKLEKKLGGLVVKYRRKLKQKEDLLTKGLNTLSIDECAYRHLHVLGKEVPKVTLEDGMTLYILGKLPPELDKEMGIYLAMKARHAQAEACLKAAQKIAKSEESLNEKELALHGLAQGLSQKRAYNSLKHHKLERLYLVFEAKNGLLLRPKQVDILNYFAEYKNEAKELIAMLGTGSGKSKILAQLMQLLRREMTPLVLNLWPSPLYNVNTLDTKSQVEKSNGQRADTFEFDRSINTSKERLRFMLRELREAPSQARQLNTKSNDIQSFELKFLEILDLYSKEKLKEEGVINLFQEILKTFRASEAHMDETHITSSPKKELNFTIGEPESIDANHVNAIEMVYRTLIEHFNELVKLNSFKALLKKEDFTQEVKLKLAESLARYLEIKEEEKESYLNYVTKRECEDPDWLSLHPKREEITTVRGEITFLLAETLSKATSVNYGLSKIDPTIEYIKPYEGNDACVETAEYDNPHETLNKTYQYYLCRRLTEDQIWKLVASLQKQGLDQARKRGSDPKETAAYAEFEEIFPKKVPRLFSLTKEDVKTHLAKINKNNELIFYYVRKVVAPTIVQYKEKFKSDAQNLKSCFGSVIGMSATPGAKEIYGKEVVYRPDKGSDELILDTLSRKCADPSTIHVLDSSQPRDILEELLRKLLPPNTPIRMIIDMGSLFKGIGNKEFAIKLLDHFEKNQLSFKGVVFFHEDHLMSLEKDAKGHIQCLHIERSQLKLNERFTYCDNKHVFGSDIKQDPEAIGLCTYDRDVDLDLMLQGVGRLRELTQNQSVEWVLTKEVKDVISEKPLTFVDLRNLSIKNQAEKEADDLFRSLKQQMKNEIRNLMILKLIYAEDEKEVIALYNDFRSFLVEKKPTTGLELYGGAQEEVSALFALTIERKKLKEIALGINSFSPDEKEYLCKSLKAYKQKIIELESRLPSKVKLGASLLETENEIQDEISLEMEAFIENVTATNTGRVKRRSYRWNSFDLYNSNWTKTTSVTFNIARFIGNIFSFLKTVVFESFSPIAAMVEDLSGSRGLMKLAKIPIYIIAACINAAAFLVFAATIALPALALAGGVAILNLTGHTFRRVSLANYSVPLFEAEKVLGVSKELEVSKELMKGTKNHKILMTNNFVTLIEPNADKPIMEVLGKDQRICHEVIVVQDTNQNGVKAYTVILGDQSTDARFFRKELMKDALTTTAEEANKRTRKVFLYDLRLGVVADSKNFIDEEELRRDNGFLELIVKTKIFNGDVNYSLEEEKVLYKMLEDETVKKQAAAIIKKSLVWKPERRNQFTQSHLNELIFA